MSRTRTLGLSLVVSLVVSKVTLSAFLPVPVAAQTPQQPARPRLKRSWRGATPSPRFQHDSISHALATMERLGHESGAYEMYIRTDSQLITKQPVPAPRAIPGT